LDSDPVVIVTSPLSLDPPHPASAMHPSPRASATAENDFILKLNLIIRNRE
jgi:hypothetical protein